MSFIKKHQIILFFVTWFLLNLIQAYNTELFDDEAYYWVYSKFPAWGYFDHPPMIALLIRSGFSLFKNEFGVRLMTVILSTLTLVIIYRLLPRKNDVLFYSITCSFAVLQIGGIIAVPDIPLSFFTALFFFLYKKFIQNMSLRNSLILGVVMALMLYSKYHGVLIILFTFISNPKLALKYQAYLAALVCTVLFLPHLYWQYTHGFPSVQYHLFERNANKYHFSFTLDYITGQILIAGPFMGWLLLWAAFRYKSTDEFERALKFSMVGFYIFFLVSTLKGRVESNWTTPIFVSLVILSHQYLVTKNKWKRILVKLVPLTLLLVFAVRIYMLLDIKPLAFLENDELHQNRSWAKSIYKTSNGLPAVFLNSYQKASKYWFYSGIPAFSLNTPLYRRNNFNFWPLEDSLSGKKVIAISSYFFGDFTDSIITMKGASGYLFVDSFYSFSKVGIFTAKKLNVVNGTIRNCKIHVVAEKSRLPDFQEKKLRLKKIELVVVNEDKVLGKFSTNIQLAMINESGKTFITTFPVNLARGEYEAKFALPTALTTYLSLNSNTVKLVVE